MEEDVKKTIANAILPYTSEKPSGIQVSAIAGGSISCAYQILAGKNQKFFCKINSGQKYPNLFSSERHGLQLLAVQKIVRTPRVVFCTEAGTYQILVMEWIEQRAKTPGFWAMLGEQLASLHHISWLDKKKRHVFGLPHDNYMGALHQANAPSSNWIDFFINYRLEPQIRLAFNHQRIDGKSVKRLKLLLTKLPDIFSAEPSSLLHGDLWNRNFLCDEKGQPVLIDPAVYFGHRSVDLAMTTLFGGFDKKFYEAYDFHFAFPHNYLEQWSVCNLYPLLIHLNLFGKSYLTEILQTLKRF